MVVLSFAPRTLALLSLIGSATSVQMTCCNDAVYTLTINLEQTCGDTNIDGLGIADTSCFNTFLQPVSGADGLILESVRRVDIFELGPAFDLLSGLSLTGAIIDDEPGSLVDGEVLEYRSVVSAGGVTPNALQVVVTAESSEGTLVMNVWQVTYQDSCILPAFPDGSRIGWTTVTITCNELYETEGEDQNVVGDKDESDEEGEDNASGETKTGGKGMMSKRTRRLQRGD